MCMRSNRCDMEFYAGSGHVDVITPQWACTTRQVLCLLSNNFIIIFIILTTLFLAAWWRERIVSEILRMLKVSCNVQVFFPDFPVSVSSQIHIAVIYSASITCGFIMYIHTKTHNYYVPLHNYNYNLHTFPLDPATSSNLPSPFSSISEQARMAPSLFPFFLNFFCAKSGLR